MLVMVIMAYTVTVPPADAYHRHTIQRHGGDIRVFARHQKPEKRTHCRVHDYRGAHVKEYRFYIDGWGLTPGGVMALGSMVLDADSKTARAGEAMEVGPDPSSVDIKQGDPRG